MITDKMTTYVIGMIGAQLLGYLGVWLDASHGQRIAAIACWSTAAVFAAIALRAIYQATHA